MITIASYSRLEDAQRDADRLGSRGLAVSIVHGGSAVIAGTGATIELQIDRKDLDALKGLEEEISDEIVEERQHSCPWCGSKNYKVRDSIGTMLLEVFFTMKTGRARFDGVLRFKCLDCGTHFKVTV